MRKTRSKIEESKLVSRYVIKFSMEAYSFVNFTPYNKTKIIKLIIGPILTKEDQTCP